MTMERGLSFGSRGPQSDFARLCWRVRIQNNNHQRHATTQGVSHAAVKHPARFRGLRAPHALYCAHQPNSAVKPTPTSSACGCPPCFALRRGLPRALGVKGNLMAIRFLTILLSTFFLTSFVHAQEHVVVRSDWKKFFSDLQAEGAIVIADERQAEHALLVFGQERAAKRYSPASTFKLPHTLFALDAGAVRDEFQVFRWDGVKRSFAGHNQDQDLRSAMRNSAVWVYELFAKEIGEDKARRYLKQIDYGNADPSTIKGDYWIDGNLEISAHEQISFLRKLYRNQLPFQVEHQRLVKDLMITEAGRNWILRAKTGWEGRFGWWVGWVEWPTGPVFFALNIDTPNRTDDLFKREAIARAILRSIDALPPN